MKGRQILHRILPALLLAFSLLAAPDADARPPIYGRPATAQQVNTRSEEWLLETIEHDGATITELDVYRNKPLAQVWQKDQLTNVETLGTVSDANLLISLAIVNKVDWKERTDEWWSVGTPLQTAVVWGFAGSLIGAAIFAFRRQLIERLSSIGSSLASLWSKLRRRISSMRKNGRGDKALAGADGQESIEKARSAKDKTKDIRYYKNSPIRNWGAKIYEPGDLKSVTIDSVIGQEEAKLQVQEVLEFLKYPERFSDVEARMPRGALLIGPPGTGKTLLAKGVAGESGITVIVVSGADFSQMYVGVGSTRIKELFKVVDEELEKRGQVILFIDEFDSLARKRGGLSSHGENDNTLNKFLAEMDGFEERKGFFAIAATNLLESLDEAAIRPGRFDRKIKFFNPSLPDRIRLIDHYLPERLRAPGLDLKAIARGIPGASGAVIDNGINEAKLHLARQRVKDPALPALIRQVDLDEGFLTSIMGFRRLGLSDALTSDERNALAIHEAGHALVYMKITGEAPIRFTIVPRGQTGGHVQFSDKFEMLRTVESFKTHLAVALGGWAATYVDLDGHHDTGLQNDIQQLTQIAYQMVTQFGMSDQLGFFSLSGIPDARLISEERKAIIEEAVDKLVAEAKSTALEIVTKYRDDLKLLVAAVTERETLLQDDFEELFMGGKIPV